MKVTLAKQTTDRKSGNGWKIVMLCSYLPSVLTKKHDANLHYKTYDNKTNAKTGKANFMDRNFVGEQRETLRSEISFEQYFKATTTPVPTHLLDTSLWPSRT